ncbi:hypothetical protein IP81_07620 [Novosphingobium sp. AAP83]|nr:hypothetical protein IP81_07620 [Novosphingobium sp. AAP83]
MNEGGTGQERRKPKPILTDTLARSIKPDGPVLPDRTVKGLKLKPTSRKGRGYWFLIYTSPITKKQPELSLGTYPDVSIAEAREKATEARKLLAKGIDPKIARDAEKAGSAVNDAIPTFEEAARQCYGMKKSAWSNGKHTNQWLSTLETYIFPTLGNRKVDTLKASDFANALSPIWLEIAETARRVKQRCQAIMKWCWAREYVVSNVVDVVTELLPDPTEARKSTPQPAMRWQDVPDFVNNVVRKNRMGSSRPLLEWLILTSARSGEGRHLTWSQIDFKQAIWNIPPCNTKMKRLHNVPLSSRCMEILDEQKAYFKLMNGRAPEPTDLVFPSPRGKVYSDMTLSKFMKDRLVPSDTEGRYAVPHGFRTSFRGWATLNQVDGKAVEEHLIELCLAHVEGNKSIRAYKREDLIKLRRPIMQAYANYLATSTNIK